MSHDPEAGVPAAAAARATARMDPTAPGEPCPSSPPPPPELAMVSRALQRLVARNDALAVTAGGGGGGGGGEGSRRGMAAFEVARGAPLPSIGVPEYLERMHRYAALEPQCYVVAYAYVDRAAHRRPATAVASRNVHRLLLACLLVASKFLDDFHHNNAFFARVGGVSNAEMNRLELELLAVLDFEVAVGHRDYDRYRDHLEKEMRRDHQHGLPGAAPPEPAKPRPAAGPPATERRITPPGVGNEQYHSRGLPNGGAWTPAKASLREMCAFDQ